LKNNPDRQTKPVIRVIVSNSEDFLNVIVEDNGPGISKEIADKIFAPFFTTKAVGKGTGLGLSISIGIITEHGGQLLLESLSQPTRFVIRLPAKQQPAQNSGTKSA
jgi:signal transduction histidine kinase